ncbi:putative DNA-dependent RNA polymerase subunit rpb9 [Cotonvirus japonicus]|uniref:DNA-dependent RNA polymerase subunit rpb9 n=1 Tax=Cotonvirus japonicus TaxID=2811091 RepID=A0ABM7NS15_9VIRU|nr:putative DNA-dependent RNA polymerase subunit rpb9 [Cotonvirus japonicus]BCS82952.1 putative DNA-dependent RNA polymerase subunit rpb9 [Cotonvirus japonicus]
MIFCEKCRYLFNITKDVRTKQVGGKINNALNNIFDKFQNNTQIIDSDLKRIKGKDLTDDERFENMTKKNKKKLTQIIKAIDKTFFIEEQDDESEEISSNKAYFICKYCKNYRPINAGTVIYTKNYDTNEESGIENYDHFVYDQTLPRTKNYICKNDDCETHENPNLKEAVLTKNSGDQIIYICTVCTTHWISAI